MLQRFSIVGPLVPEYSPEFIVLCRAGHEAIPIVMRDLVAKMPEQGPVGLLHLATTPLSLGVIRLRKIDCNHPVGVARHNGRSTGRRHGNIRQEIKSQPIRIFHSCPHWKTKSEQRVKQSVLSNLDEPPMLQISWLT